MIASVAALKEILPQVTKIFARNIKIVTFAATIFFAVWSVNLAACLYAEYDLHCQFDARDEYFSAHKNDDLIVVKPLEIPDLAEKFWVTRTWDEITLW